MVIMTRKKVPLFPFLSLRKRNFAVFLWYNKEKGVENENELLSVAKSSCSIVLSPAPLPELRRFGGGSAAVCCL